MIKIAPSILSADFADLSAEVNDVVDAGAEWLHVDVMDGLFVPNISIGIPVVRSLRKATNAFLDVHLMIDRPQRYVEEFCKAGADQVVFHVEAAQPQDIEEAMRKVLEQGKKVGLAVKPRSPATVLLPWMDLLDTVLVMTVEPGFGGQRFMVDQLPKIRLLREMLNQVNPECDVEVDGGIDPATAPLVTRVGANVLVAGSAVFGRPNRADAIQAIRDACYQPDAPAETATPADAAIEELTRAAMEELAETAATEAEELLSFQAPEAERAPEPFFPEAFPPDAESEEE